MGPPPAWRDAEQAFGLCEGKPPAALGAREEPQETRIPRQEEPLEVVVVLVKSDGAWARGDVQSCGCRASAHGERRQGATVA